MMTLLPYAIEYRHQDLSVMPLNGKRPVGDWQYYQSHLPSEEQINLWWQMHKTANIGIITGSVSHLIVIDFDHNAKLIYPRSYSTIKRIIGDAFVISQTGKGFHCIIRTEDASDIRNKKIARQDKMVLIETRGEGGYIVAPPSIHPESHKEYKFTNCKRIGDLLNVPGEKILILLNELRDAFDKSETEIPEIKSSSSNGTVTSIEVENIDGFISFVLKRESEKLANACHGERNDALFRSAAILGGFGQYIDEGKIYETLLTGCDTNGYLKDDGPASAVKTIKSAMSKTRQIELVENPFKGLGVFK